MSQVKSILPADLHPLTAAEQLTVKGGSSETVIVDDLIHE